MKKILLLTAAMLCFATTSVQAQDWLDALKGVATSAADKLTGGKLTQKALIGSWNYSGPGVKMGSSNLLADVGGTVMSSTIESKLRTIYEKVGIREGFCSITFEEGNAFSMPLKSRTISGTYEYDASSHAITLHVSKLSFTGYAYIDGSNLQLVFPADKLVSFMTVVGSMVSSLSTITEMLKNYDNVLIGFEFAK